jgi:hypothetical protein
MGISSSYLLSTHQDSCTTQEGTQIIAAGVSEQDDETTVEIWISQPILALHPSPTLIVKGSGPVNATSLFAN